MGLEDKNYTVHSLRHTAATIYFEYNNRDILLLKEILGHSTILSTEIYTHTYNDLVKEAVMKNPLSEYGIT
jgi:site-specific recombinase XerD